MIGHEIIEDFLNNLPINFILLLNNRYDFLPKIINLSQTIAQISLLVKDYDEAIEFYTKKLKFKLLEDTVLSDVKRWVVVSPEETSGCNLLLAKAKNEEQVAFIGNQTGGRVFLFMHTSDFDNYYQHLLDQEVTIVREKTVEDFGVVAVFADLYGNLWDLIQHNKN